MSYFLLKLKYILSPFFNYVNAKYIQSHIQGNYLPRYSSVSENEEQMQLEMLCKIKMHEKRGNKLILNETKNFDVFLFYLPNICMVVFYSFIHRVFLFSYFPYYITYTLIGCAPQTESVMYIHIRNVTSLNQYEDSKRNCLLTSIFD